MATLTIALLQMSSVGIDLAASLEKGEQFCRLAKAKGADLALFPEMWNNGYLFFDETLPTIREQWLASAITPKHSYFIHFQSLARELDMAIGLTYLETKNNQFFDSLALIDRHGNIALNYSKVHTLDMNSIELSCTPGTDFEVCNLDTTVGTVKIGAMICFDCFFPESARLLMLKGAEIIVSPNADGLNSDKLAVFRTRAYENMVGFATTNYAKPDCNGHSVAYDGVAYEKGQSRDMLLVEADESETIALATFDLERMRNYREEECYGNKWRRPTRYHLLSSAEEVAVPFLRQPQRL